jgi:hypothetical protein
VALTQALRLLLREEHQAKWDHARILRRKRASIPEMFELQSFPYAKQPKLDRQKLQSLYDSLEYVPQQQTVNGGVDRSFNGEQPSLQYETWSQLAGPLGRIACDDVPEVVATAAWRR